MINTHNGVREKGIKPIDIEDYPAIKKHLDTHLPELEKRLDKGITPYNLRNCAYMEDFYKQKIVYPNMTKYMPFLFDSHSHFYTNDKGFIITGENIAFLTAFLNSSLFKYCFIDNFPELQGGTREVRKIFLDKIPVKKIDSKSELKFQEMISNLQNLKKENKETRHLEEELDKLVFDIYNLSMGERELIGFIEIQ